VVDIIGFREADDIVERPFITIGMATFLLLLPLAVAQAVTAKGRASWAYAAASIVLYAALVSSQTRSAWIASALAGVVLLGLLPKSRVLWRRGAALAVAFVIVTVVLVISHPGAALPARGASALDTRDYSMRQKLYVWKHTLPLIAERPVAGWGFSTLVGQFKDMGSPEYLRVFGRDQIVLIDTPHNELLHVAYSTGLLGLAAVLWLWIAAGRALLAGLQEPLASPAIGAALAAALCGYFIWMQFAWSMIGPANVFWVVVGLAATVSGPARAPRALPGAP
jgi:O-antigen ligase